MSVKFTSTKITNASSKVDKYLNTIYVLKDKIKEDDIEFLDEFMQDIDSWRVCLDEIDLSIKKHLNTEKQNEYKIDKVKKEIIIYKLWKKHSIQSEYKPNYYIQNQFLTVKKRKRYLVVRIKH